MAPCHVTRCRELYEPRANHEPRAGTTSQVRRRGRSTGERRLSSVPARVGFPGGYSRRRTVCRLQRRQWTDSVRISLERGLSTDSSTARSLSRSPLHFRRMDLTPGWLSALKLHSQGVVDIPLCSWCMAHIHTEAPSSPCDASKRRPLTLPLTKLWNSYRLWTLHIGRKYRTCKVDV